MTKKQGRTLIELEDLTLGYGSQAVLEKLNLEIERGDFVCIVGQNGAGKTTLVRGILGLLKPLSGRVIYHNVKRNQIGFMPQETAVERDFPATIMEIVLSGTLNRLGWRPFYGKKEHKEALRNLRILGIDDIATESFAGLSGGQRQKVLLARALTAAGEVLILDEPSNNLDSSSKTELYQTISKLNHERGMTILMVTHDLDHHNLIGDKILSLRKKEVFFGPTEEYVRRIHGE